MSVLDRRLHSSWVDIFKYPRYNQGSLRCVFAFHLRAADKASLMARSPSWLRQRFAKPSCAGSSPARASRYFTLGVRAKGAPPPLAAHRGFTLVIRPHDGFRPQGEMPSEAVSHSPRRTPILASEIEPASRDRRRTTILMVVSTLRRPTRAPSNT